MTKLEIVQPTLTQDHLNVLLYGPAKSGKTTGASTAPGPILYCNADQAMATRYAHSLRDDIDEVRVRGLSDLYAASEALIKQGEDGRYKTVVLDTVGDTYRHVLDDLSQKALRPPINLRGDTSTHIERFCRLLIDLPVHVVFVAHEIALQDEQSGEFDRLPYTGTKNPVFGAKMMAAVDVIGYTGVVESEDHEERRYMATLVDTEGRRGGDRTGALGRARDVNISEWIALADEKLAGAGRKEGSP